MISAKAKTRKKKAPLSRSEIMRAVKSKNTKPERAVRQLLRQNKISYRSYGNLPGHPDLILKEQRLVIRVMGCFWHKHDCKNGDRIPKSNVEYWTSKIKRNVERDKENKRDLKRLGWRVVDIWECQLRAPTWKSRLLLQILKH